MSIAEITESDRIDSPLATRSATVAAPAASAPRPLTAMEDAVRQAVIAMGDDLCCDDGITGIAADTFYSKFHFTREFTRIAGTTPRRYLAALRMRRAKELLHETDLGVVDVSTEVGYFSVGTFSTRFSHLVGMSPKTWRQTPQGAPAMTSLVGDGTGVIQGIVELGDGANDVPCDVFVAVYEDSVMQGRPIACTRLDGPGALELVGLPTGDWVVSVLVRAAHVDDDGTRWTEELRARRALTVYEDPSLRQLPARFRPAPASEFDPPVIFGGAGTGPAGQAAAPRHEIFHRSDNLSVPTGWARSR